MYYITNTIKDTSSSIVVQEKIAYETESKTARTDGWLFMDSALCIWLEPKEEAAAGIVSFCCKDSRSDSASLSFMFS